jgi:hypothetical protein
MPDVIIPAITLIDASQIRSPAPVDIASAVVDNKISAMTVATQTVSFTPITGDTDLSLAALNQTTDTLRASTNAGFLALATAINVAFGDLNSDSASQVAEINARLASLQTGMNAAFENIRVNERNQTEDLTTAVNTRFGEVKSAMDALKAYAEQLAASQAALDETFATDADLAAKLARINSFIETIDKSALDLVSALDLAVDELNGLRRVEEKEITVTSANGVYDFVMATEGFGEFIAASDYTARVQVWDNAQALAFPEEKTKDGFKIRIKSHGKHFIPQPWQADAVPVKVVVTVTHGKRDPLTLSVDAMGQGFTSAGGVADASPRTIGAGN